MATAEAILRTNMLFVGIGPPSWAAKQDVVSDVLLRPWKPLLRNGGMIFQSVGSADPVNYPGSRFALTPAFLSALRAINDRKGLPE